MFETLIHKHFPSLEMETVMKPEKKSKKTALLGSTLETNASTLQPANVPQVPDSVTEEVKSLRASLLAKIESVGQRMPTTTLDKLICDLGGPTRVAEVFIQQPHFNV